EGAAHDRTFWLSEAGREAQRNARLYVLVFDSDGNFRVDDVLPGIYELNIQVTDPNSPDTRPSLANTIGVMKKEIIVPDAPPGTEAIPFDAGVLELQLNGP
ncbi:MAG TPA: hypothetical protein VH598_04505, partial [Verrucomicrobiae bacterium]|nr:hypothetical protein [Verrucomicrobiae bacterium]